MPKPSSGRGLNHCGDISLTANSFSKVLDIQDMGSLGDITPSNNFVNQLSQKSGKGVDEKGD